MMQSEEVESENRNNSDRLKSGELAELIIDALLRAEILSLDDVARGIEIAKEEIEVRKALGDY